MHNAVAIQQYVVKRSYSACSTTTALKCLKKQGLKVSIIKNLFILAAAGILCACTTTAPIVLKGSAFETKSLADSVGNQRVAISGKYASSYVSGGEKSSKQYCAGIEQEKTFETKIAPWAPNQTNWSDRKPNDIVISYLWTCDSIYTDSVGFSAVVGLLTIGLAPVKSDLRLRLGVRIAKNNKEVFNAQYEKRNVMETGFGDKSHLEGINAYFVSLAHLLMENFTKELDRDGALDK
jgi:hypothetical protein